jgi:hypothetical protein
VLLVGPASAATIYNMPPPPEAIAQQFGNNWYYIGDDVTTTTPGPHRLDSVTLSFTLVTTGAVPVGTTYTPDLTMDIFAIDPITRLPIGGPLATAAGSNPTLTAEAFPPTAPLTFTDVVFDFTSAGLILPTDFAILYHDDPEPADFLVAGGLSAAFNDLTDLPSPGFTAPLFLLSSPNDPNSDVFEAFPGFNLVANIQGTVVPVPGGVVLALAGIVTLGGYARRRRAVAA